MVLEQQGLTREVSSDPPLCRAPLYPRDAHVLWRGPKNTNIRILQSMMSEFPLVLALETERRILVFIVYYTILY